MQSLQLKLLSFSPLQPFQEASLRAREQYKVDFQRYQAQLTPAEVKQQTQDKRQRRAKRKAIRKKRVRETIVDKKQGKA